MKSVDNIFYHILNFFKLCLFFLCGKSWKNILFASF